MYAIFFDFVLLVEGLSLNYILGGIIISVLLNYYDPEEVIKMNDNFMDLKEQRIWLCWNFREKDGRKTKVPIAASGEKTGTDEAHSGTWVTFGEAKKAAEKRRYSGVGFVIPKGYFFLDIDHREWDDPYIKMMLERFGSYAEKSVSGEGLHIYGKCDFSQIPTEEKSGRRKLHRKYYQKNPGNGTELYIGGLTNRFAVFTGNIIQDKPLKDCTNAVLVTLEKDMARAAQPKPPLKKSEIIQNIINGGAEKADCSDLIRKLQKQRNGERFRRLFDKGDLSDYCSHSEADLALCCMIAFWSGNNPDLIDSVFRKSALYREKWERDDYREETISKAIASCGGVFHRSAGPKPPFIREDDKGNYYVCAPALAKYVRKHHTFLLVRDNGKQAVLIYVYENGVYKLYDEMMFKGIIKDYIAAYDEEMVRMNNVNEVYQNILTDRNYISQDELNAREDIINFKNGLLVVTADEIRLIPHSPSVYSTIQIPCNWSGEKSDAPVFIQYLKTLTNGDGAAARLLLQFIGACLSNVRGWRMKKSLFLVGDGDTGKSQLKSLVERLLGKGNFIGADLSEIEARFGTGTIYGTRLAGSSDMSFMTVSELKTFKKITGGDSLFAEFKGQQGFEFTYSGLLWFCMNRLPKFGGDDGKWVYNRIMVVNCPNVIPPEKQDKQLLDKMYAERDGIIYLAVRALQKVIRNGYRFDEPETVTQAREDYMRNNNTVFSFFEECMIKRDGFRIGDNATTGKIYKVYVAWCRDNNGGYAKTARDFRDDLCAYLSASYDELTKRSGGNTYYKEYTLSDEIKEQYADVYGYVNIETDNGSYRN